MRKVFSSIVFLGLLWIGLSPSTASADCPGGTYSVKLESYGAKKINAIKVVRTHLSLSIGEAKNLVEAAPVTVAEGMTESEANAFVSDLQAAGAEAETEGPHGCSGGGSVDCPDGTYSVKLLTYGANRINTMKVIRTRLGLGMKDSKELVESAPVTVSEGLTKAEADSFVSDLQAAGAEAEKDGPTGCGSGAETPSDGVCSQITYRVKLLEAGSPKKKTVKVVKKLKGLSTKESKKLVESAPVILKKDMSQTKAKKWKAKLKDVGAKVKIKKSGGCD